MPQLPIRFALAAPCLVLLCAPPAHGQIDPLTGIDMVIVGSPGNAADPSSGLGAVAEPYRIARFEVTNSEYVELLNAVAANDINALYDPLMTSSDRGGIERFGSPESYTYAVKADFDDKPAVGFDWYAAARYCNWLQHGKPTGAQTAATTEDGAYNMALPGELIHRQSGATWFIPTHDEWYKACYFDPLDPLADLNGTPDYWFYPTRSDVQPTKATSDAVGDVTNPGPNIANVEKGADWNGENGNVTTVGGCAAPSPWGTFDMGGNANEITETLGTPIPGPPALPTRRLRGGDFSNTGVLMGSSASLSGSLNMLANGANIGARVASFAPWFDVSGALAGTHGEPTMLGAGMTTSGTPISLTVTGALENAPATLVLGLSLLSAAFKGGTLVPNPDLLIAGLSTDVTGSWQLASPWPAGVPSGTSMWVQLWVSDVAGPAGFAASNGLLVRTP